MNSTFPVGVPNVLTTVAETVNVTPTLPAGGIETVETVAPNVNWSALVTALTPAAVVTMILTVPGEPVLSIAVICVPPSTVKDFALWVPNFTDVAPMKLEPTIVTVELPPAGPSAGVTSVTDGAGKSLGVVPLEAVELGPVPRRFFATTLKV
jgi:hypothetical protein